MTRKTIPSILGNYALGLLAAAAVGLVLGLIFRGGLVSTNARGLEEIADYFSMIFFVAPLSFVFWKVGEELNYRVLMAYPVLAFLIAPDLPNNRGYESVAVTVMVSYVVVHAFMFPVRELVLNSRSDPGDTRKLNTYHLALAFILFCALPLYFVPAIFSSIQERSSADPPAVSAAVESPQIPSSSSEPSSGLRNPEYPAWDIHNQEIPDYHAAKWFRIRRWGISFPLTEDLKDVYNPYPRQRGRIIQLNSPSLGRKSCVAGGGVLEVYREEDGEHSISSLIYAEQCWTRKALRRRESLNRQIEWSNRQIRKYR